MIAMLAAENVGSELRRRWVDVVMSAWYYIWVSNCYFCHFFTNHLYLLSFFLPYSLIPPIPKLTTGVAGSDEHECEPHKANGLAQWLIVNPPGSVALLQ